MPSDWNKRKTYKKKNKGIGDSFFLGFIPSFLLPIILNIVIFKMKWSTDQSLIPAMIKFARTGLMRNDMISALIPSILLIIVFSSFRKEKASIGSFVGLVPSLVVAFIYM